MKKILLIVLVLIAGCSKGINVEDLKEKRDEWYRHVKGDDEIAQYHCGDGYCVEYTGKVFSTDSIGNVIANGYIDNGKLDLSSLDGQWTYHIFDQIKTKYEGNYKDGKCETVTESQYFWSQHVKGTHPTRVLNFINSDIENDSLCETRHGIDIEYYSNGQIESEGYYKDEKLDGKVTLYNEDGSINKVIEFKDGALVE